MNRMMFALVAGLTIVLVGGRTATAADNAEKLLGAWTVVKMDGKEPPKDFEIAVEFMKEGKMKMTMSFGGKSDSQEGTYKVEGDKIISTKKGGDKTDTIIIKTLTADKLIVVDDKDKKEMELTKKK